MKKYLLIFALILPLVFTACSDDDDDLDGTVWEAVDEGPGYKDVNTLYFSKNTVEVVYYSEEDMNGDGVITEDEIDTDKITVSYSYDDPVVTFYFKDEVQKATISGNKMTTEKDEDGDYIVFKKK